MLYEVITTVTHGVVHKMHFILAAIAMTFLPLIVGFKKLTFEGRRWSESDFSQIDT